MNYTTKSFQAIKPSLMVLVLIIGFTACYVLQVPQILINEHLHMTSNSTSMQSMIVVGTIIVEQLLLIIGNHLIDNHPVILIMTQLIVAGIATTVLENFMPLLLIAVIPVVAIEIIIIVNNPKKHLFVLFLACFILLFMYGIYNGWLQAVLVGQALIFILFVVNFYWRQYNNQRLQQRKYKNLVSELSIAYSQVEESTKRTERQRVARELHDTLIQGVAGTIMQLEAAQTFLENGNNKKALNIVKSSIDISRTTMQESRITLSDLRSTSEKDLASRLNLLVDAFKKNYSLKINMSLTGILDFSDSDLTNIVRIVSEAMMNVVKHAHTDEIAIKGYTQNKYFRIEVSDKGLGWNAEQLAGHYGIQGMDERANEIGGQMTISSNKDKGSTVTLTIPIDKKE